MVGPAIIETTKMTVLNDLYDANTNSPIILTKN